MRVGTVVGRVAVFLVLGSGVFAGCGTDGSSESGDPSTSEWIVESAPVATVGLDDQSREIRAFSGSGTHLWTAGGPGDGPSEFAYPTEVGVRPDGTIDVPDLSASRVVLFSAEGAFLESSPIPRSGAPFIGAPGVPMTGGTIPLMGGEERRRAPTPELSISESTLLVSFLRQDSAEVVFRLPGPKGFQRVENGQIRGGIVPFGRVVAWDSGRSIAVAGNGHVDPTVITESSGSRQIPSPFPRLPVTRERREEFLATRAEDRDLYAEILRSTEISDSTASYDRLLIDSQDRVWVRRYQVSPDEHRWAILDSEGTVLGSLSLPLDAQVLDADDSRILIRRETDLGVQFVELRRFTSVDARTPSI